MTERERRIQIREVSREYVLNKFNRMSNNGFYDKDNVFHNWRDGVNDAYDNRCAVCGYHSFISICEVHHIKPVKDGGVESFDNLILLCPNCHRSAHKLKWGKEKFENFLVDESEYMNITEKKEAQMRKTALGIEALIMT